MPHIHKLPDGTDTGSNKDLGNDIHDHEVSSVNGILIRTEATRNGDTNGHVHTVLKSITGPAIKTKKK